MEIIQHQAGHHTYKYPKLQTEGFAAQYAFPFAQRVCQGHGLDVGYNKPEWMLPGATGVEPEVNPEYQAMRLPDCLVNHGKWDYIFSSHCLEHVMARWQEVIEYWLSCVRKGGTVFLYLPNCSHQKYWGLENKKHMHYLTPEILEDFLYHMPVGTITHYMVTKGYDLNSSFYVVITK